MPDNPYMYGSALMDMMNPQQRKPAGQSPFQSGQAVGQAASGQKPTNLNPTNPQQPSSPFTYGQSLGAALQKYFNLPPPGVGTQLPGGPVTPGTSGGAIY